MNPVLSSSPTSLSNPYLSTGMGPLVLHHWWSVCPIHFVKASPYPWLNMNMNMNTKRIWMTRASCQLYSILYMIWSIKRERCVGSVVKRLQLCRLAPVDATCTERQSVSWTTKMYYVDLYSHTSNKLVHRLDLSVVKAQTLTKHRTRKNCAYSTPKSVHITIRMWEERIEKRKKQEYSRDSKMCTNPSKVWITDHVSSPVGISDNTTDQKPIRWLPSIE